MVLHPYQAGEYYDEIFSSDGRPRAQSAVFVDRLNKLSAGELQSRQTAADTALYDMGITFAVYGNEAGTEKVWPFDIIPRIVDAAEWQVIEQGLKQRVRALNLFIDDIYHEQRILKDKVIPESLIVSASSLRGPCVGARPPKGVWCHITGVDLNGQLQREVKYVIRLEPGVQTCDETLTLGTGSCRDSAWLMVQILRNLGMAARFVSGYLIQLVADQKPLEGPDGPSADFTDLHAWCEVYLPGAGWVGLDPTSGLLAGEGHIPLACTPEPSSAAPLTGATGICETEFSYAMKVTRIHEDPRVTKPYTEQQWQAIQALGDQVDRNLQADDVRLTMGGEPTFVSIDDMEGDQWRTEALGATKRTLAERLLLRLKQRYAEGGLLHVGQGKWYPGEQLPRWAMSCFWRQDGEPMWRNAALLADTSKDYGYGYPAAETFANELCRHLRLDTKFLIAAFEDAWYYLWRERRLPVNVHPQDARLEDEAERSRLARVFEQGLGTPVGCVLPLRKSKAEGDSSWQSSAWPVRADGLMLIPGDSPIGLRLPLDSLPWAAKPEYPTDSFPRDPLEEREPLAAYSQIVSEASASQPAVVQQTMRQFVGVGGNGPLHTDAPCSAEGLLTMEQESGHDRPGNGDEQSGVSSADEVIHTAMCVEPRGGQLYVFMPPVDHLEDYLQLLAAVEETAETLGMPVVIEGYTPPQDHRIEITR